MKMVRRCLKTEVFLIEKILTPTFQSRSDKVVCENNEQILNGVLTSTVSEANINAAIFDGP